VAFLSIAPFPLDLEVLPIRNPLDQRSVPLGPVHSRPLRLQENSTRHSAPTEESITAAGHGAHHFAREDGPIQPSSPLVRPTSPKLGGVALSDWFWRSRVNPSQLRRIRDAILFDSLPDRAT
jgi:hypothetical protein